MVQNSVSSQHNLPIEEIQQQPDQDVLDTSFLNWQEEEFYGLNDDSPILANTRAKKRALESYQLAGNVPPTPVSILKWPSSSINKDQNQRHVDQSVPRSPQKVHFVFPYNIVDSMKKINVTMTMWETLAIPGHAEILREGLSKMTASSQHVVQQPSRTIVANSEPSKV